MGSKGNSPSPPKTFVMQLINAILARKMGDLEEELPKPPLNIVLYIPSPLEREQGWCSGESARLSNMARVRFWLGAISGLSLSLVLALLQGFFSLSSFPPFTKTSISKFCNLKLTTVFFDS